MKTGIFACAFAFISMGVGAQDNIGGIVGKSIQTWVDDPVIISSIKAQNEKHANLTHEQIIDLDQQWRTEVKSDGGKPLVNAVLSNELSSFLKKIQNKHLTTYTEVFVMDNKGLNVGQSVVTSDYWQGDEDKWKETYLKGADAKHIAPIEKDPSTGKDQTQISFSVSDPETNEPIGAVTIGINVNYGL